MLLYTCLYVLLQATLSSDDSCIVVISLAYSNGIGWPCVARVLYGAPRVVVGSQMAHEDGRGIREFEDAGLERVGTADASILLDGCHAAASKLLDRFGPGDVRID